MRILLTGATGFIGSALARALRGRGHVVVAAARKPAGEPGLQVDFAQVPSRQWWAPHLAGIDAVVNAVGILRETAGQRFAPLHSAAPIELFHACVTAGVARVIQVSALGADEAARSRYHLSKKAADDVLRSLPLQSAIVQPSVVYGPGAEAQVLFDRMARAPVLPLPRGGSMAMQPVHLDDVVDGLVALVERGPEHPGQTLAFCGPAPLRMSEFLAQLRLALGVTSPLRVVSYPEAWFRATAWVAGHVPGSMLDSETAGMLLRGSAASDPAFTRLLGRAPRGVAAFITG